MALRAERPKEKATAEAFQQALDRVGIKLNLKPLPGGHLLQRHLRCAERGVKTTASACAPTAGAPTGTTASASCRRSSTAGPSAPAATTTSACGSPRSTRCSTQRRTELDQATREAAWGAIDKRVMEEAVVYPGVYAKGLLLRLAERDERLRQRGLPDVRLRRDGRRRRVTVRNPSERA